MASTTGGNGVCDHSVQGRQVVAPDIPSSKGLSTTVPAAGKRFLLGVSPLMPLNVFYTPEAPPDSPKSAV